SCRATRRSSRNARGASGRLVVRPAPTFRKRKPDFPDGIQNRLIPSRDKRRCCALWRRDRMSVAGRRDEPMSDEWVSFLVAWLPFILLLLVFAAMARWQGMRSRGPWGHSLIELYEQQVAETRRVNATLERIALALEQRANQARS